MAQHPTAALPPAGWQVVAAYRGSAARTLFVWLAALLSLLASLLAVLALLGDSPLWLAAATALILLAWWRMLRPLPGPGDRLWLCREGIAYSRWPFRALPWQAVRETELVSSAEGGPHRILLRLEKHFTLPQDEHKRLALPPAGVPEVVEIVPDTLDTDVRALHAAIAERLARQHAGSYPARRLARGLSATGL